MKNKFCWNNIIICLVVLIVIYQLYSSCNKNIENFAVCDIQSDYVGNPLISRDGTNITYEPSLPADDKAQKVVLGNDGSGWYGNVGDSLIVRFNETNVLKSIIISGYGKFKIDIEVIDPGSKARSWKHVRNSMVEGDDGLIFNGGNTNESVTPATSDTLATLTPELSKCFNLSSEDGSSLASQAVRFVVHEVANIKTQLEILGIEPDASPGIDFTTDLNNYANLYNENNTLEPADTDNMLKWNGEVGNTDQKCTVKFESSDSVPIANKLISYVEIRPNGNNWLTSYNIAFRYNGSNVTRHITDIGGNAGPSTVSRYYFKYPLLANELVIKPSSSRSFSGSNPGCKLKFFGKIIRNENEEKNLKSDQETQYQLNNYKNTKSTCPPIGTLINKQAEIQQLCDALEQTDQIEFEKKKIDTNKLYQLKLSRQRKDIQVLQAKIKDMRDANKYFDDVEDRNKVAMFKYQEDMDKKLKGLVKNRLEKQVGLNFNMSVNDPTAKTDVEPTVEKFTNNNSNKFQRKKLALPSENFYEEFVGSYYFN